MPTGFDRSEVTVFRDNLNCGQGKMRTEEVQVGETENFFRGFRETFGWLTFLCSYWETLKHVGLASAS